MTVAPKRPTEPAALRELFNSRRFFERAQAGEILAVVVERRAVVLNEGNAESQMVEYFESETRVALVHQYVRAGQVIQRPDPKWLLVEGVVYHTQRKRP
jgi:hypothetical protein